MNKQAIQQVRETLQELILNGTQNLSRREFFKILSAFVDEVENEKQSNKEPLSSKMTKNPYTESVDYKEFLSLLAERLESIKGVIGAGAIHEINNLQGLMLNQIKIIEKKND